jgi:hypothetical protein
VIQLTPYSGASRSAPTKGASIAPLQIQEFSRVGIAHRMEVGIAHRMEVGIAHPTFFNALNNRIEYDKSIQTSWVKRYVLGVQAD